APRDPAVTGIEATVPSPLFVTNKKLPAGATTACHGALMLVVMLLTNVNVPSAAMENDETELPPLFGTKRNCPKGSIAGNCGALSEVNGPAPIEARAVRLPSGPIVYPPIVPPPSVT